MIRASIIGATGYTGIELIRLLSSHPQIQLAHLVSETYQGQEVVKVLPHLNTDNLTAYRFTALDIANISANSDVVFLALPHKVAAAIATQLIALGNKVIDLSADLRLKDGQLYRQWYDHDPADNKMLQLAVYGLAELNSKRRDEIAHTCLIANPGCYPTASILAVAPLVGNGLLDDSILVLDAKSGVSGAGRACNLNNHYCETVDSVAAYGLGGSHRHIPEIEQELSALAQRPVVIQFTPHLLPMPRGMMVSVYWRINRSLGAQVNLLEYIIQMYRDHYHNCHFIRLQQQQRPTSKTVIGTNYCDISLHIDQHSGHLVIVSTIDNLLKGASGQAVQNMNIMYGLPEYTALQHSSVYP